METTISVNPAYLHAEINKLWKESANKGQTRSCLFNLVFYTPKGKRADYLRALAKNVLKKFPSHLIFIEVDEEAQEVETRISVFTPDDKERKFACDLIEITLPKKEIYKAPFILCQNIIADLPTYIVWGKGALSEGSIAHTLEKYADRIIFDSEVADNISQFSEMIYRHAKMSQIDIGDLNWARLSEWRALFSSVFKSEQRLEELTDARTVKIEYNCAETAFFCHTKIQSAYFVTWLANTSNWTLSECQENRFIFKNGKKQVVIELVAKENHELPPGAILECQISTHEDKHFHFTRDPEAPRHICMVICSGDKCDSPISFPFSKGEHGRSLVSEIGKRGTSSHFLNALKELQKSKYQNLC